MASVLRQRDVVDAEARRQPDVGRRAEVEPRGLTAPGSQAARVLRVVARLVKVESVERSPPEVLRNST